MARPKLSYEPLFRVTVTAEEKVVEEFDDACRVLGLTRSEVMRHLMRQWVDDNRDTVRNQEVLPVAS
jgi:metal-responsive CopG/Arc/MetJ family transcriptional regulator